jgi:hypothetical protein
MVRITDISLLAGDGTHPRPHVHGMEPSWGSKFWASEEDDELSLKSDDDDITSPTLVTEALEAGFTIDQIHQAEEELESPSSEKPKVSSKVRDESISKKLLELWSTNCRSRVRPWKGPLSSPRQSLLHMLGDVLANAKFE